VDDFEVRDNLTVETWPVRIEDREVNRLRGKEIALVKIWVGPTGKSVLGNQRVVCESRIRSCFLQVIFEGENSF